MDQDHHLARAFRAVSHPSRARLFRLLCDNPEAGATYRTLQDACGLRDATLTHHLREMERCGLLVRRRHGQFTRYRVEPAGFARALSSAQALTMKVRMRPAA